MLSIRTLCLTQCLQPGPVGTFKVHFRTSTLNVSRVMAGMLMEGRSSTILPLSTLSKRKFVRDWRVDMSASTSRTSPSRLDLFRRKLDHNSPLRSSSTPAQSYKNKANDRGSARNNAAPNLLCLIANEAAMCTRQKTYTSCRGLNLSSISLQ